MIDWWNIELGETEISNVISSIQNRNISQGKVTEDFEIKLAEQLEVPYVVCTTSGTVALLLAYMAIGIGPGDEVIVPNRTYIATAHPALLLGAKIKLVDVYSNKPILDENLIENQITSRTKAIVPVHLNGRSANMEVIDEIAKKHDIVVIEDAAQAFLSKRNGAYLGTLSRFGCFSLGMAKLITTGQGGFLACHIIEDQQKLLRLKNQGIFDVNRDKKFDMLAGNFKFTDIQASIGLAQLTKIQERLNHQVSIYKTYDNGLKSVKCLKSIDVEINNGEIPLRTEYLCTEREKFIELMLQHEIAVISQIPSLNDSPHLESDGFFKNSQIYSRHLINLPCGPNQPMENVIKTIKVVKEIDSMLSPW